MNGPVPASQDSTFLYSVQCVNCLFIYLFVCFIGFIPHLPNAIILLIFLYLFCIHHNKSLSRGSVYRSRFCHVDLFLQLDIIITSIIINQASVIHSFSTRANSNLGRILAGEKRILSPMCPHCNPECFHWSFYFNRTHMHTQTCTIGQIMRLKYHSLEFQIQANHPLLLLIPIQHDH